jgi:hypothetical protein
MITFLIGFASHWAGARVPCRFKAWADGKQLSAKDDTGPVYRVPDGTVEVKLTATPQAPLYWETTVFLSIGAAGVTAKPGSAAFVKLATIPSWPGFQNTTAIVRLSRFKDVTADTLALLSHPPSKRHILTRKGWVDTPVDEVTDHQNFWGTWPPADWGLHNVHDAHFLDATTPVKSGALNFAQDTSLKIDVDSVVLRLAGVDAPQLFAVTWPKTIAPKANATPTPFLIFIRQANAGNGYDEIGLYVGGELDRQPYPSNFDYADTLFEQLHYKSSPLFSPGMKGVPYQVAKAGANVVTVIPSNSFEKDFGVMDDTEQTGKILEELQAFMFLRAGVQDPPASVGKTAFASFSSGNFFLGRWLANPANRAGSFLSNVVTAVYFLDPILDPKHTDVNTFIKSALTWAGTADKRIRLYMRYPSDAHVKLLGKTPGAPYVQNSADKRRTAAVISDDTWVTTFKRVTGGSITKDWQYSHHIICATMLTHALAQGDLS